MGGDSKRPNRHRVQVARLQTVALSICSSLWVSVAPANWPPTDSILTLFSELLCFILRWPLENLFSISFTQLLARAHPLYFLGIWEPGNYGSALSPSLLGFSSMSFFNFFFCCSLVTWNKSTN